MTLCLLALLGRVAQLQFTPPQPIAQLVDSQHSVLELQARRGPLLDRNGRVIASSDTICRLFVDPQMIDAPDRFSEKVGNALGYDPAWIEHAIDQGSARHFVLLDPNLSEDRRAKLTHLRQGALGLETRLVRNYPRGAIAGQLLGFVGFAGKGMEGLEKVFDKNLTGTPGRIIYLRDAARHPLWIDGNRYTPPVDGQAVRTSIDSTIQAITETELRKTCQDFDAQSGQIVVLNPWTGEILALANYPTFDPNDVAHSKPDDRRNRCIADFVEPGSIFKPFVWSAATQMGLARPDEMIDCTAGLWVTAAGRRLHDAHGCGMQTWEGVLIKSSNIGMGKIGERLGPLRMYRAVTAFGFGQVPGSGLEGESPGMVNQLRRWTSYSVTSIPMGQEVGVTPLQIARGYCTFANGGLLIRPTILALDDPAKAARQIVVGRVLLPAVAARTRAVLRRVVLEGTGKKAESRLYTIFGKTGTAQIAGPHGGYTAGAYVASFIGGAPLEHPRLIVACMIHHPDPAKGHFGGLVAAPAVKNIIEQSLLYLGVPPDQPPPDDATHLVTAAAPIDARE